MRAYDPWSPATHHLGALAGEEDFMPLRAPAATSACEQERCDDPCLSREDIRPGMRCVNGEWLYSARWL